MTEKVRRVLRPIAFSLPLLLLSAAPLAAITITWTGANNTDWTDNQNWNPIFTLPVVGDDVVIPNAANDPVLNIPWPGGSATTFNGLTLEPGASLDLNGNSFTDVGNLTVGDGASIINGGAGVTLPVGGNAVLGTGGSVTIAASVALSVAGTTTINVGAGNNLTLDNAGNNFIGAVSVTGASSVFLRDVTALVVGASTISGNLELHAGGTVTQTGAISTAGLELRGAGPYTLTNAGNAATTLAVTTTGAVSYRDTNALVVGSVGGTSGITTTNDNVSIRTGGTLTISQDINLGGGDLELNAGGAVTQGAGDDISADGLELIGTGPYTLTNAGNAVTTVAVDTAQSVDYRDTNALLIGSVGGTNGITTTGDDVSIQSGGSLGINQAVSVAALNLLSNGAMTQTVAITTTGAMTLAAGALNNMTLDRPLNSFGGTVSVISGNNVTLQESGVLDLGGSTVSGDLSVTSSSVSISGPVTIAGGSTMSGNLVVNSGSVSLSGPVMVAGSLDITGGSLSPGSTVAVSGNWSNSGTFVAGSSTVIFDGTGTSLVSGSTTFHSFACTSAGKILSFQAGSTQTIDGALTLAGASGNNIQLLSQSTPTQWTINNVGDVESASYVSVQDSAVLGNDVTVTNGTNLGNVDTTPPGWVFAGTDITPPHVNTTNPMHGASDVSIASAVSVTFSEIVSDSTINGTTLLLEDSVATPVGGSVVYDGPTRTATLTPAVPLSTSTTYTATITTGVEDLAGNPLTGEYSWTFTTEAAWLEVSTGTSNPGNRSVGSTAEDVVMVQLAVRSGPEDVRLSNLRLTGSGSGNEKQDVLAVRLSIDEDSDGIFDDGEALLSTGTYPNDDGTVFFTGLDVLVPTGSTVSFLVLYDFSVATRASTALSVPQTRSPLGGTLSLLLLLCLPLLLIGLRRTTRASRAATPLVIALLFLVLACSCLLNPLVGFSTYTMSVRTATDVSASGTVSGTAAEIRGVFPIRGGIVSVWDPSQLRQ